MAFPGYEGALLQKKNERLDLTEYTQAALVTTCLAMEKVVEEYGLHPDVTAGLSLGGVLCNCCFRRNERERRHHNRK